LTKIAKQRPQSKIV